MIDRQTSPSRQTSNSERTCGFSATDHGYSRFFVAVCVGRSFEQAGLPSRWRRWSGRGRLRPDDAPLEFLDPGGADREFPIQFRGPRLHERLEPRTAEA
jgi:hypothetical protein